ncbi:MAG: LamG-like jellyroll fold domain-containing protein [Candidatus Saccharicenans sp.]|uniref:LamG-like jellyroll fold domain-containing protein n=1 Tax=Candidatus Saccharicenans sp. TaxID=2819258 RepID=UPI0040498B4A
MRKSLACFFFILVIIFGLSLNLLPATKKLIYLDASILPEGRLQSWRNLGTLGGNFIPVFRTQPTVEVVKNQKAVNLTAVDVLLRSTFSPPNSLSGRQPFTLLAKVLVPELAQRRVLLSWSQQPEAGASFGIGKGIDAAFYHSTRVKLGYQKGYPEPGLWHLMAFVCDRKTVRVYVDGWLKAEVAAELQIKPDKYFYLGGETATGLPLPVDPFNGYLASLELLDGAYSQLEIWNLAGRKEAIPLFPEDNELLTELALSLRWERGDEKAVSFAVYFSRTREEVDKASPKALKGKFPAAVTSLEVTDLKPGQTYFWRVDQLDGRGQLLQAGMVRQFSIDSGAARDPVPHHQHGSVRRELNRLTWNPGPWATSQDVYFSQDPKKLDKAKPLVKDLKPGMNFFFIPEKNLKYGQSYFWRVDTRNGSLPASPGQVWSFRVQDEPDDNQITFLVAADLHYGGSVKARKINREMVLAMNSLPGQKLPEEFGLKGKINTPRGVVILGDIVDDGGSPEVQKYWHEYVEDFGLKGDGLLAFPVYEGFGEHDGPSDGLVRTNLRSRNRLRPGLRSISADGQHYSWDWGRMHFVHLNLYPGSLGEEYLNIWRRRVSGDARYPRRSLEFLIEDLRRNVGSSGRPVIIFQHYGFDSWSEAWWTQKERNTFLQAIQPYNVIAIFWGHSHVTQALSWNELRTWCAGSLNNDPEPGTFLVVSLKTGRRSGQMIVAARKADQWLSAEKTSFLLRKVPKSK